MLKIGHRGAKGHVSENTIESFLKAFELGAHGVELDVHKSLDDEVVVIHDETVDRTIKNAAGFVKDFTVLECRKIGVPTLVDVFHVLPENAFLNIEIKDSKTTYLVVELVEKFSRLGEIQLKNIVISSFNWGVLLEIAKLNASISLGVLTESNFDEAFEFAKNIKAFSIHPFFQLLTPDNVAKVHRNGIKIFTWTVNSPEDITFVKNLGVDAIISDYPDRL